MENRNEPERTGSLETRLCLTLILGAWLFSTVTGLPWTDAGRGLYVTTILTVATWLAGRELWFRRGYETRGRIVPLGLFTFFGGAFLLFLCSVVSYCVGEGNFEYVYYYWKNYFAQP